MKRIYKYGTGDEVPEGAQYLYTDTETQIVFHNPHDGPRYTTKANTFVWHYFLVEVDE